MGKKIKKDKSKITLSGDLDDLSPKMKLAILKKEYTVAQKSKLNYAALKEEIQGYKVEPQKDPTIPNMAKVNARYAEAQSYLSRVTAIEVVSIDNHARWKSIVALMEDYIEEKTSDLLISDETDGLTNLKAEAKVRNLLKSEYNTLRKLKVKLAKAESLSRMITTRKKDLVSVLQTLSKQVNALALEQSLQR